MLTVAPALQGSAKDLMGRFLAKEEEVLALRQQLAKQAQVCEHQAIDVPCPLWHSMALYDPL